MTEQEYQAAKKKIIIANPSPAAQKIALKQLDEAYKRAQLEQEVADNAAYETQVEAARAERLDQEAKRKADAEAMAAWKRQAAQYKGPQTIAARQNGVTVGANITGTPGQASLAEYLRANQGRFGGLRKAAISGMKQADQYAFEDAIGKSDLAGISAGLKGPLDNQLDANILARPDQSFSSVSNMAKPKPPKPTAKPLPSIAMTPGAAPPKAPTTPTAVTPSAPKSPVAPKPVAAMGPKIRKRF